MSESFARLTVDNGEILEATAENTSVYKHLGAYALYDHVFIASGESSGSYIWKHHESHQALETLAIAHFCLTHLNIPEVSDFDREQYEKQALSDLGDSFPEEWEKLQ